MNNYYKLTLSIRSGRLVAAIMVTLFNGWMPSNSVNNCDNTRSWTFEPLALSISRSTVIASISSKNTTLGDTVLALRNISRTAFSDSPTHLLNNSAPYKIELHKKIVKTSESNTQHPKNLYTLIEMKFSLLSEATAFAIIVFEQPGGPNSKIPRGGLIPRRLNDSGCFKGHSRTCWSFSFKSSCPPISFHLTWIENCQLVQC